MWYREWHRREKEIDRKGREDEGERAVEVEGRENPSHSGRHLRVIGKRIPRDSPPSNIGVAHPRRELPRDSSHPDGSVWGARPSYHRHALGECHPRVRVAHWSFRASWSSIPSGWKSSSLPRIAISVSANISPYRIQDGECRAAYEWTLRNLGSLSIFFQVPRLDSWTAWWIGWILITRGFLMKSLVQMRILIYATDGRGIWKQAEYLLFHKFICLITTLWNPLQQITT